MAQSQQEKVALGLVDRLDQAVGRVPKGYGFPRHVGFVDDLRHDLTKLWSRAVIGKPASESELKGTLRKMAIATHGMKTRSVPGITQY
ncbi:MAG: hypothetical protein AAB573_02390 [Patescibacteria group bacterium]